METLSNSNELWFCWDYLKNNISCISLDSTKIQRLFGTLPKQTTISESRGIPFFRTSNRKNSQPKSGLECVQCKLVFHLKCQKNPNVNTFVFNFWNKETLPLAEIDRRDLIDLSFNSNYICSCLENNKLKNNSEDFMNKIINLKELNFGKNQSYSNKDPNDHVIDPTNFSYYLTHDFHKLHKKNSNKTNNTNFSVLHTNICSLQGNFDNFEQLLNNLEYEIDIIALTETWHTEGNQNFIPGLLTGYQNYEGISGSTLKGGCGFYIKSNISFVVRQELTKKLSYSQSKYESNWIEIMHTSKENPVVGVVYRHPKQKDTDFLQYLKQTFKTLSKKKKKVILTGELNINLLNFDKNKEVNEFLGLLTSN